MLLRGRVIKADNIDTETINSMYSLMEEFYDQMNFGAFIRDLSEKAYCIMLYDEDEILRGFSTQRILKLEVEGREVFGVFSGDTIIHRAYWGNLELQKLFAEFFIEYGSQYEEFYWFLISKGYKTYKMLPLFFKEFYPNYRESTPAHLKAIMNAFGRLKYPEEYDDKTGIICYKSVKDKLKPGVADIAEKQLRDKDIVYFINANPEHIKGNDLVCLARLAEDNLRSTARRLLLGK